MRGRNFSGGFFFRAPAVSIKVKKSSAIRVCGYARAENFQHRHARADDADADADDDDDDDADTTTTDDGRLAAGETVNHILHARR